MLIAKIAVTGVHATSTKLGTLTTGMVGARVQFTFDSHWDGLNKTAVFRCMDITKDVLNIDSEVTIPHEVLVRSGSPLYAGVYGTNADGDLVIPTRWATVGIVYSGADPSGDTSADPSLPIWLDAIRGPKVAEVGQTIVVKAVDENGKPTEWETADLPQGGGGSAGWTKRTITLEEAVTQISFELPSAKKMFVVLYLHVNDKDNSLNTGNDICMMKVNNSFACRFDCYTRQSGKFVNVIDFEKVGSHKKLIRTNQYPSGPVWNGQEAMYMSGWQHLPEDKPETINTVIFFLNGANLLFQNDSYLEVYYQ